MRKAGGEQNPFTPRQQFEHLTFPSFKQKENMILFSFKPIQRFVLYLRGSREGRGRADGGNEGGARKLHRDIVCIDKKGK